MMPFMMELIDSQIKVVMLQEQIVLYSEKKLCSVMTTVEQKVMFWQDKKKKVLFSQDKIAVS